MLTFFCRESIVPQGIFILGTGSRCPVEADVAVLVVADEPMRADGAAFDVTGKVYEPQLLGRRFYAVFVRRSLGDEDLSAEAWA
jgi:hypothetical protein